MCPQSRSSSTRRLEGLDLARALAFAGMLLAHFASPRPGDGPGWVRGLDAVADGRAAPLFCVLLGVGAGLLTAGGSRDVVIVRRGLLLFLLGVLLWPYTPVVYLILPHYGVLLALMPLLRRVATRWLLPLALVAFAVPSLARSLMVDDRLRATLQPDHFSDLADIGAVVRYLLWTGGYPLVGWVGFALVGLWLYRELPRGRGPALRLALVSGALVATQPLWAEAREALGGSAAPGQSEGLAAFFDTTAHSNMFGWYVLASASAVAAAALCLVLVPGQATRGLRPLVLLGQLALTAYVAHLVLGEQWLWEWERTERPSLLTQLVIVGVVVAAFAAVATLWRSRFQRGPLEAALRVAAG